MSDPEPKPPSDDPSPDRAERVLRIFLEEPMLWPVGLVVLLTFATFGGAILVFAIRSRAILPGVAMLLLIFMTVWGLDADIRARRLRPVSWIVLGTWVASGLVAVALESLGAL